MMFAEGRNFPCSKCHASALCHQEMNCFGDKPQCSSVREYHLRELYGLLVCKLLKASSPKMSM